MYVVVCGAGMVGSHAAEVLAAAGHSITLIDQSSRILAEVEDTMDVGSLCGNCASAEVLREAGAPEADLVLAATESDEINLLTASMAKGVGAKRSIARIHHRVYFEQRGLDYRNHLGIDHFICPEFSTSQEIARTLRNPAALAIEKFAEGRIEMQEFPVSEKAEALGKTLSELRLPDGSRLAAITRGQRYFLPEASTTIEEGDVIVLAGNSRVFQESRRLFQRDERGRQNVVIMGEQAMSVWLCRALRDRNFSIRLFVPDRERAEELADKLDWVTIIHANPTEVSVFEEEHLEDADAFVALSDDDEQNILGCVWAKSRGVKKAIAVAQRPTYLHLFSHIGIDRAFSPRIVAVKEIEDLIDENAFRQMATLAEGFLDVYRIRVGERSEVVGRPLKEVKLSPNWVVAAVHRGEEVWVPSATDSLRADDVVLLIGHYEMDKKLKRLFDAK